MFIVVWIVVKSFDVALYTPNEKQKGSVTHRLETIAV